MPPAPTNAELEQALRENAAGPKRSQGDQGSVEEHPIPDMIALDRHFGAKAAVKKRNRGIRTTRLIPPSCAG